HYARLLADLCHDRGMKVLVAATGSEALALVNEFSPTAISLDVFLPDMLGWTVLNHLKQNPATRHIPVQMLTMDEDRNHGRARRAFSSLTKRVAPAEMEDAMSRITTYATQSRKHLLLVEDNPAEQLSTRELLSQEGVDITICDSGSGALELLGELPVDCMVL